MSQTAAELLVDMLQRIGVKQILGLISDSLKPIADVFGFNSSLPTVSCFRTPDNSISKDVLTCSA
jgi:hypothetical protein